MERPMPETNPAQKRKRIGSVTRWVVLLPNAGQIFTLARSADVATDGSLRLMGKGGEIQMTLAYATWQRAFAATDHNPPTIAGYRDGQSEPATTG